MEDEERRKRMFSVLGEARASWPIILGLLAAMTFLSGLSYFHGFFGKLGFGSLVFSLPPQAYFAVGGIATVTVFLTYVAVTMGIVPIAARIQGPRRPTSRSPMGRLWHWFTNVHPLFVIAAGLIEIVSAFAWTWSRSETRSGGSGALSLLLS